MSNAPSKPVSFSRPKVGYFSNRPRISNLLLFSWFPALKFFNTNWWVVVLLIFRLLYLCVVHKTHNAPYSQRLKFSFWNILIIVWYCVCNELNSRSTFAALQAENWSPQILIGCIAAVLIRSQVYQSVLFVTFGNQIRSLCLEILREVWSKAVRDLTYMLSCFQPVMLFPFLLHWCFSHFITSMYFA